MLSPLSVTSPAIAEASTTWLYTPGAQTEFVKRTVGSSLYTLALEEEEKRIHQKRVATLEGSLLTAAFDPPPIARATSPTIDGLDPNLEDSNQGVQRVRSLNIECTFLQLAPRGTRRHTDQIYALRYPRYVCTSDGHIVERFVTDRPHKSGRLFDRLRGIEVPRIVPYLTHLHPRMVYDVLKGRHRLRLMRDDFLDSNARDSGQLRRTQFELRKEYFLPKGPYTEEDEWGMKHTYYGDEVENFDCLDED